ncbi:bacteriocin-processing peptidase. Cysteine peptidase. MEROPS family C39 [Mucilaginibacter mallensis]|uniref:Bacteriocin-processing peptidase. Cysteine peptidase. MEROPS family C39 n=1 Tax=Mucilaginibacter mallensis TaxID=652787 RepID=A0A1H1YVM8_MUCMA|nr:peptidase domain-containing ABC transporter [Mucilaginibacter mallensis]SDT25397.1 bacteriocin-processing peptidase. Cysteine peptidase. MEROPS family C39 [Mucilaginibacter mallensis]
MRKAVKIKQRDITDCGAACIVSVAAHYQLQLPVSRIRQYAGTDKKGTNILGMIEAAEKLGFQAKGAKGGLDSLSKIPLPAIAHVILKNGLQHFVVIYKVNQGRVTYMDPADGSIYKVPLNDFKTNWTGVIILLLPGEHFSKGNEKTSNAKRFWQLLAPHKVMMFQALIGAIIYTILGLSMAIFVQKIIDFVLTDGNIHLLNLMSIAMIAILLFQIIINFYKSLIGLHTGQMMDARLILGYYKHLLKLPQRFFDTMRVGEIISRVNDAVKIRVFINDIAMNMAVNVLIIAFSMSIMFLYYWKLALITLSIIPAYTIVYWISNQVNKKWQRKLMETNAELETQLVESINSAATIKRFGLEDYSNLKTENNFIELLKSIYISSVKGLHLNNAADFSTRLITIIILWSGSYFVIQRELSPGELLSFYALIGYFTGPAASLIGANKNIQDALIAADRLFEIIDLETEAVDDNKIIFTSDMIGDIQFNNVHFKYDTRTVVFNGLNIIVQKNSTTAIVGESGSGKSTLLSLMQNLYPLKEGNITIGGLDIKYISNSSLRRIISIVPQKIDLFAGTVIDNIAIGDYEPDIKRVIDLSTLLGINEFIEKLPDNYYSVINEQGANLSGGQKQRIAIARALYRNPEILIMDEATSSLDPTSEQKVQTTLAWFKKQGKTIIIIAHRLSTIKNCDEILVLRNGELVEQGSHSTLLESNSYYKTLWQYHVEGV